jgi:transcriptional regulator with XRE-family HTH domain
LGRFGHNSSRQTSGVELSYRAHVHRTYVSDVERGARNPTVKVIWKLAEVLDTAPSELFRVAKTAR